MSSDPKLESIVIDARLVRSGSRPISNRGIQERKLNKNQTGKNGKPLKFSRDLEADWRIKKDTPHYGLKEHTSVDTNHGFVLAT